MKIRFFLMAITLFSSLAVFTSCSKEETVIVDSSQPQGTFAAAKTGSIVPQNDTKSQGTVKVGTDTEGNNFVMFSSDFATVLATGTVTVYLSTSQTFKPDPGKGNPDLKLIGAIAKNGEQYIKLSAAPETKFTHLILWCGSANVPFGYAQLK